MQAFLFQGAMNFNQHLSGSNVIFLRASKFLFSVLLFIQIREKIKDILKTKEGQGKKWLKKMELSFSWTWDDF